MTTNTQKIKTGLCTNFIAKLPTWLTNINSLFYYYLFLVVVGIIFFATSLFINSFTTPFTGDYVTQQYAFYTNGYDDWWHFFRTGEFVLYDTNTFLGVDNIGSNSFYYLFDPFFLPILMFPRQFVPQGMAILTIFKMALSGMAFYAYMRYLGASRRASKITGLAYAFSGWITWYLWFNHFTGVAVAFPLILLGIEYVLKNKKPLVLMSSICLIGFINFFFMFTYVLCALFYALFRYIQRIKINSKKDNLIILLLLVVGFAIGILMPMMVVYPSLTHALSSPRASNNGYSHYLSQALKTSNLKKFFDLIFSWTAISNSDVDKARSLYPFIEFIFPVTSCRGTPLTIYANDTYDNLAGSFYCFIPMLLLLFPAFKHSIKQKHYSVLVPLAFFVFALFTPCFYYLFFGFTAGYSRWTLFVVTSIMAYSGLYLDKIKQEDNFIVLIESAAILILIILIGAFAAQTIVTNYSSIFKERFPIWLAAVIEILYVSALVTVLILLKIKKKRGFYWGFSGFLVFEISLMGALVIHGHGVENYYYTNKGLINNNALHSLVSEISKNDNSFYRSYSSLLGSTAPNDGMRNNYNSLGTFHSVYNYNTADLCNWSSITNGRAPSTWSGTYVQKRTNLDTLLGVKYYFIEDNYFALQNRNEVSSSNFRYNVPLNYIDVSSQYPNKRFKVFKNTDYIDFALTYDSYYEVEGNPVETSKYSGLNYNNRNILLNEELYLQCAIINKYRESDVLNDIKINHPDLHLMSYDNRQITDYYYDLKIGRYGSSTGSDDAVLTYYDFFSSNETTLNVDAKEYLSLNESTTKYTKLGKITDFNGEQRYVEIIESKDSYFPNYDPLGNIYYLTSSFDSGYETDIYFIDIDNKVVTFDDHNDGFTNAARAGKEERGFYIAPVYSVSSNGDISIVKDAPKIKKIIFVNRGSKVNTTHHICIDTFTSLKVKNDALKDNVVTDVKIGTNKYSFKTNFSKEQIMVTRLAYEDGFSLIAKDTTGNKKDINVFNAQGGFASFISEKGDWSYELTFNTPNLKTASLISCFGVFGYMATMLSYFYIDTRRKEKEIGKLI